MEFSDLSALRTCWNQYIGHGALMVSVYPPPAVGESVVACVALAGTSRPARLDGEVLQSSTAATIVRLSPLSGEARIALAEMGLQEANAAGLQGEAEGVAAPVEGTPPRVDPASNPRKGVPAPAQTPLSQTKEAPVPSLRSQSASSGSFEWAYHLWGKSLKERQQELPEATRSGEVGETGWRDSLISFFMEKLTGVVVIRGFREDRWMFLVEGCPVHYVLEKTHPGESLGGVLIGGGVLARDQWESASGGSDSELAIAEVMVDRGLMSRAQLRAGLHQRAAAVTRSLVRANFGDWSFCPLAGIGRRLRWQPVDVLSVLLDAERRGVGGRTDEEIVRGTEPLLSRHVTILDGRAGVLEALPLVPRERRLASELLPGGWTIKELFVYGELGEQELLRFLLVLKSLGAIVFLESEGEKTKRNRAERALYVGLRELTKRGDFEAIHCHWTAIDEDVERGYRKLLEDFSRERFAAVLDDRIEELIERVQARARELYEKLKGKEGRDRVRKLTVGPSQLIMATDLMGKQGTMAAYKGRFDVARVCYLRVLELAVKGPECAEAVRTAQAGLALDSIQNATTSVGPSIVDLTAAVDKFLSDAQRDR